MGGDDNIYGEAGTDELIGGTGNDLLDGGPGADTMNGGPGDDTYYVDAPGDVIQEAVNEGIDSVWSSASNFTLPDHTEILILMDGAGDISGTGNNLDNILRGNNGNNTLNGGAGNDILSGGGGNDLMIGGSGEDKVYLPGIFLEVDYSSIEGTNNDNFNILLVDDGSGVDKQYKISPIGAPQEHRIQIESGGNIQELRDVEYLQIRQSLENTNSIALPLHQYKVVIHRGDNGSGSAEFFKDGDPSSKLKAMARPSLAGMTYSR